MRVSLGVVRSEGARGSVKRGEREGRTRLRFLVCRRRHGRRESSNRLTKKLSSRPLSPSVQAHLLVRLARNEGLVELYAQGLPFFQQRERNEREMNETNEEVRLFFLDAAPHSSEKWSSSGQASHSSLRSTKRKSGTSLSLGAKLRNGGRLRARDPLRLRSYRRRRARAQGIKRGKKKRKKKRRRREGREERGRELDEIRHFV